MLDISFVVYRAHQVQQTKWGEQFYGRKAIEIKAEQQKNGKRQFVAIAFCSLLYICVVSQYIIYCIMYNVHPFISGCMCYVYLFLSSSVCLYVLKCKNHPHSSSYQHRSGFGERFFFVHLMRSTMRI